MGLALAHDRDYYTHYLTYVNFNYQDYHIVVDKLAQYYHDNNCPPAVLSEFFDFHENQICIISHRITRYLQMQNLLFIDPSWIPAPQISAPIPPEDYTPIIRKTYGNLPVDLKDWDSLSIRTFLRLLPHAANYPHPECIVNLLKDFYEKKMGGDDFIFDIYIENPFHAAHE